MAQSPLPPLPEGPRRIQVLAIARGIKFYRQHGMKVNRAYTPANMRRTAAHITGRTYPASAKGLEAAQTDLEQMLGETSQ